MTAGEGLKGGRGGGLEKKQTKELEEVEFKL